jgi:hypothetical protein
MLAAGVCVAGIDQGDPLRARDLRRSLSRGAALETQSSSWPGLSRPSTPSLTSRKDVDARDERGHDDVAPSRRDSYSPRPRSERGAARLAHLSGGQGVASSNLAAPTSFPKYSSRTRIAARSRCTHPPELKRIAELRSYRATLPHAFFRSAISARHLEALEGNRKGQHSIRINDQYRICFVWTPEGPIDVEVTDYTKEFFENAPRPVPPSLP